MALELKLNDTISLDGSSYYIQEIHSEGFKYDGSRKLTLVIAPVLGKKNSGVLETSKAQSEFVEKTKKDIGELIWNYIQDPVGARAKFYVGSYTVTVEPTPGVDGGAPQN